MAATTVCSSPKIMLPTRASPHTSAGWPVRMSARCSIKNASAASVTGNSRSAVLQRYQSARRSTCASRVAASPSSSRRNAWLRCQSTSCTATTVSIAEVHSRSRSPRRQASVASRPCGSTADRRARALAPRPSRRTARRAPRSRSRTSAPRAPAPATRCRSPCSTRASRITSGSRKIEFAVCLTPKDEASRVVAPRALGPRRGEQAACRSTARSDGRSTSVTSTCGQPVARANARAARAARRSSRGHGARRTQPRGDRGARRCCRGARSRRRRRRGIRGGGSRTRWTPPTADDDGSQSGGIARLSSINSSRERFLSAERSPRARNFGWSRYAARSLALQPLAATSASPNPRSWK